MDAMSPSSGIPYAVPYPGQGVTTTTTTQSTYDAGTYGLPNPPLPQAPMAQTPSGYPISSFPQPVLPPSPVRPPLAPNPYGQPVTPYPPQTNYPYPAPQPVPTTPIPQQPTVYPPQQTFPQQPFPSQPIPPTEESYIENILRLNRGKIGTFYMTYSDSLEWRDRVYRGVIEAAGVDHIVISDPKDGKRYVLLSIYLDWIEFNEEINYDYPIR